MARHLCRDCRWWEWWGRDDAEDPEGRVRSQLAALSARGPLGQHPPLDLVDCNGQVVTLAEA